MKRILFFIIFTVIIAWNPTYSQVIFNTSDTVELTYLSESIDLNTYLKEGTSVDEFKLIIGSDVVSLSETVLKVNAVGTLSVQAKSNNILDTLVIVISQADLTITPNDVDVVYGDAGNYSKNGFELTEYREMDSVAIYSWLNSIGNDNYTTTRTKESNTGTYTFALYTGPSNDNYNFKAGEGTLTVVKRELYISVEVTKEYGNQLPEIKLENLKQVLKKEEPASGLVNGDKLSTITTYPTPIWGDINATSVVADNPYTFGFSINGEASNYTINVVGQGKLTVIKRNIVIGHKKISITYGESRPGIDSKNLIDVNNKLVEKDKILEIFSTEPTLEIYNSKEIKESSDVLSAGDYTIRLSTIESENYNIQYQPGTLTVNKKNLIISLNLNAEDTSVIYGENNPEIKSDKIIYDGFIGGDNKQTSIQVLPEIIIDRDVDSPVSAEPYKISFKGFLSENYSPVYQEGNLYVTKRNLYVKAILSKEFGDPLPSLTDSDLSVVSMSADPKSGLVKDDKLSEIFEIFPKPNWGSISESSKTNETGYEFSFSNTGKATNYEILTVETEKNIIIINKREILLKYPESELSYGQIPDALEIKKLIDVDKRLLGSDQISGTNTIFSESPKLSYVINGDTIGTPKDVGNYKVQVNGGNSLNYNLKYEDANFKIKKKKLNVKVAYEDKDTFFVTYGNQTPVIDFEINSFEGFEYGENSTILNISDAKIDVEGDYTRVVRETPYKISLKGIESDNYDLNYDEAALIVSPRDLTISLYNTYKLYGTQDPIIKPQLSEEGLMPWDSIHTFDEPYKYQGTSVDKEPGTYTTSFSCVDNNYKIEKEFANLTILDSARISDINDIETCKFIPADVLATTNHPIHESYHWLARNRYSDDSFETLESISSLRQVFVEKNEVLSTDSAIQIIEDFEFQLGLSSWFYKDSVYFEESNHEVFSNVFYINVIPTHAHTDLYAKGNLIVCPLDSAINYQWGNKDVNLPNENSQYLDYNKYNYKKPNYWVEVTNSYGCTTKIYFNNANAPNFSENQLLKVNFPNPVKSRTLQIECSSLTPNLMLYVDLFDIYGNIRVHRRINISESMLSIEINMENLSNGVYYIRCVQGNSQIVKPVLLTR